MDSAPVGAGGFRSGRSRAWQAIPFLLGAEATLLLVWPLSGRQISYLNPGVDDLASGLLVIAPLVTVLVALGFGWVDRRPAPALFLVGLTLVGPVLFVTHLTVHECFALALGGLIATPAFTAAAAGLVSGLRRGSARGCGLLAAGGVLGFLALALPMWALGVGSVAECPIGCNSLEMRGIAATAIFVGVAGFITMTPGFAMGSLTGRRLHVQRVQENP
jgi:hypothetical protein